MHESERVGKLLGRILEKQYPNARDIEGVSFDDLLDWHMWPIFITIFGILRIECWHKLLMFVFNSPIQC